MAICASPCGVRRRTGCSAFRSRPSAGGTVTGIYGLLFGLQSECALPDHAGMPADARLDEETGLCTATIFAEELGRRFDRLDVEEQPGTLLYLGFARTPPRRRGAAVLRLANELKEIIRPTDLLGRVGETTLALWCDGMDHLTGGERAARFCTQLPPLLPARARLAVGVAPRRGYRHRHRTCQPRFARRRTGTPRGRRRPRGHLACLAERLRPE